MAQLDNGKIVEELAFLRDQWYRLKKNKDPNTFQDIADMVQESFLCEMSLRFWKLEAPTVLKLIQIILATAGKSAYAERKVSLARRLKS